MTTDTEIRRGSPVRLSGTAIRDLALIELRRDGGTQSRVGNHEETVEEYAGAMRDGRWQWHQGNALIAYGDNDGTYWLADGFHRIEAAARAGLGTVPCDVRPGSRRDAVLYAVGANSSHGLRRTRQDVRRAIELLVRDEEWGKWSNAEIARRVGCTDKTVAVVRGELEATSEIPRLDTRMGADGKARTVPVAPANPEPHPDPANAPLTDAERYDLSLLGGFEPTDTPDSLSSMGTRQITLTDTRNRAGWEPERRTASAWRHELASLQVEAERKAAQAQKAARAEALIERAKGLGYDLHVQPSGKVLFSKYGAPYGGEKDMDAADARLDGIERANAGLAVYMTERNAAAQEADQREAQVSPAPAHPTEPRGVLLRHADELLAGLLEKLAPAELRLVNALAMHDVELDTDDEDVKAELWEHRHHFLHQLTDEELRWIEAGA